MKLILVRHGETHLNKTGRIQGIDDAPLNATGRAQARAAAEALTDDLPFFLYHSTVARAAESAGIIADHLHVAASPLDGLEEFDVGELSGLTGKEMREHYPDFMQCWSEDPSTARSPGDETITEVQERAWRAITGLLESHPTDTVVAVSHHMTILTIVSKVLGLPLKNFRRLQQNLGGIARAEITQDRRILLTLNETWHLRSLKVEEAFLEN